MDDLKRVAWSVVEMDRQHYGFNYCLSAAIANKTQVTTYINDGDDLIEAVKKTQSAICGWLDYMTPHEKYIASSGKLGELCKSLGLPESKKNDYHYNDIKDLLGGKWACGEIS